MKLPGVGLGRDVQLLAVAMFFWDFGIGVFNNLWAIYVESLGASPKLIGLLVGGQSIIRVALTLPSGVVADHVSRRKLLVYSTLLGVPATIIYGFATTWWHLIPGLLLMALTNFSLPALSSYISDAVPSEDRAKAFSYIYTMSPAVAFIIAPTFGGWLVEATNFRAVFIVAAVTTLITAIVFWQLSDITPHAHEGPKATYREALAVPAIRMVTTLQLIIVGFLLSVATFIPVFLKSEYGVTIAQIGWLGSIAAVGSILLTVLISRVKGLTASRGIALGSVLFGVVCAVALSTGDLRILGPAFLMRGSFMVTWSLFYALLGDVTPARLRGRAFGLAEFMSGIGIGVFPFLAGWIYGQNANALLLLTIIVTPLVAIATLYVERYFVRPAARSIAQEQALEGMSPA
jgi:MFS family permease